MSWRAGPVVKTLPGDSGVASRATTTLHLRLWPNTQVHSSLYLFNQNKVHWGLGHHLLLEPWVTFRHSLQGCVCL